MPKLIKTISMSKTEQAIRKIFGALVFSIIIMASFYVYFAGVAVAEIISRKNNIRDLQEATLVYQEKEEMYFSITDGFNLDYVYSLGFVDQKNADFAVRTSVVASR